MKPEYQGTLVRDLIATVDRVLALPSIPLSGAVHEDVWIPRDNFDAAIFLADAKMCLANKSMDEGDEFAWWVLDIAQERCWRNA